MLGLGCLFLSCKASSRFKEFQFSLQFPAQADARGCVSGVVRTKIFQLQRRGYEMSIDVQSKITEDGTGMYHMEMAK